MWSTRPSLARIRKASRRVLREHPSSSASGISNNWVPGATSPLSMRSMISVASCVDTPNAVVMSPWYFTAGTVSALSRWYINPAPSCVVGHMESRLKRTSPTLLNNPKRSWDSVREEQCAPDHERHHPGGCRCQRGCPPWHPRRHPARHQPDAETGGGGGDVEKRP